MSGPDGTKQLAAPFRPADWTRFSAHHWRREPVLIPGGEPAIPVEAAWQLVVRAAGPFRAGTRFFTLPDVRYYEPGGQLRAPGSVLPGEPDGTVEEYQQRLDGQAHHLIVAQPFHLDFSLWCRVRDLVAPLWVHTGVPVAPVIAELTVTNGLDEPGTTGGYDVFSWVLAGHLRAGDLCGSVGDLLYWPAERRPDGIRGMGCLALRLLVPIGVRPAAAVVGETIDATLQRRRDSEDVPYLPYESRGSVMPPLAKLADELTALVTGPDLEHQLRIRWAKRVSAAALEPVPPPRGEQLVPGALIEAARPIVRMAVPDGSWIWAVNGHAFTVRGVAGDRVTEDLRSGRVRVDDGQLLPLYRKLHSLGAITVVEGTG